MPLPPDRGHLATELQQEETIAFDTLSTIACVEVLSTDHLLAIKAVQRASKSIATFIDAVHHRFREDGRLIYMGSGTSGRLGVLDAAECPPTFQSDPDLIVGLIAGGESALRTSSESAEDNPNGVLSDFERIKLNARDSVLGITAGGTTPWVIGGLQLAAARGAMTGLLSCTQATSEFDHTIMLQTGAEPLTGSTRLKAGTATKLTLNIITTTLFTKLGKVYGNRMVDLSAKNEKLLDRAIRMIAAVCVLEREQASVLLEQAEGNVKVAILMYSSQIDLATAKTKLENVGGFLRSAL